MRRKQVPLPGLPLHQLLNMDSTSIKEHSVMQSASGMGGDPITACMCWDLYGGACAKVARMVETSLPIYVSEVCYNAGIEPTLQPITDERLCHSTADTEDGGHVDIKAQGFWGSDRQCAFFDVWVFNPLTQTYHSLRLATCHRRHKQEKKMAYDQLVREVKHSCFSPIVFSVSPWWYGPHYLQEVNVNDCDQAQSALQSKWSTGCAAGSISLLRFSIMCIRVSRKPSCLPSNSQRCYQPCPLR